MNRCTVPRATCCVSAYETADDPAKHAAMMVLITIMNNIEKNRNSLGDVVAAMTPIQEAIEAAVTKERRELVKVIETLREYLAESVLGDWSGSSYGYRRLKQLLRETDPR